MNVCCPKCVSYGKAGLKWHATGRFGVSRRGLQRAHLVCDDCGYRWFCVLPEALDAGARERGENEIEEQPPASAYVPQPSLPGTRVLQAYRPLKALADAAAADFKRKAAGEDVA